MSTDSEIIERSLDRPAAFAEIYDRHHRAVYRYAARRLGDAVAEDVMAETFLVAFEIRARFDLSREAGPWLFGIATTLMKRHSRLEARAWKGMIAADLAAIVTDPIGEASERLDARLMASRMGKALARMPHRDRDVLLLYAWGDLDYQGIAVAVAQDA